ncbi:MAG: zinc-finger domain-containing protein [Azospirillum sp.]|nr:zinc-finger domain-containing protein [Azospirillum sp.]MCA3267963.1 zinc-finger domain-containing protein [Azospirillum sp.]MCZ8124356.1 zinc-finger domain-containing protein [Magnetospirillum sp.]
MSRSAAIPAPPETIEVDDTTVACDGGGGALGHPRVYLTMRADGTVECPYCDRVYVLKGGPGAGHGH